MHKNLVLDMGNVLVTYNPVWVIQEYTDREVLWLSPEEFINYPLAKPQQKIWQAYLKRSC